MYLYKLTHKISVFERYKKVYANGKKLGERSFVSR